MSKEAMTQALEALRGSSIVMTRAIAAGRVGERYSYIQARDGAMIEATGPINSVNEAIAAAEVALAAHEQEPVAQPGDWLKPTTALHRMTEAVTLLCNGRRPPDALVSGWLDGSDDGLQDFAADNGPAWSQGIGLLDAARIMAEQPTEGVDHQEMPAAPAQQEPTDEQIDELIENPWLSEHDRKSWVEFARAVLALRGAASQEQNNG